MSQHFFTVPIQHSTTAAAALNPFLRSQKVVAVERPFVADGAACAWADCITVADAPTSASAGSSAAPSRRGKNDYKEVLAPADFALFARLRALRKRLAEEWGVPPYALFDNAQLAQMATQRITRAANLAELHGVGPARIQKYGEAFVAEVQAFLQPSGPAGEGTDATA